MASYDPTVVRAGGPDEGLSPCFDSVEKRAVLMDGQRMSGHMHSEDANGRRAARDRVWSQPGRLAVCMAKTAPRLRVNTLWKAIAMVMDGDGEGFKQGLRVMRRGNLWE